MASNLGVNYAKTSGKARHKWMYRMLMLRNTKASTFRGAFRTLIQGDTTLQDNWATYWDNVGGYLSSRGMALTEIGNADPVGQYASMVGGGKVPYNVWSGQALDGMTRVQAKAVALEARRFRCRFELLFKQYHNIVDMANIVDQAGDVGGEGGAMDDPPVHD